MPLLCCKVNKTATHSSDDFLNKIKIELPNPVAVTPKHIVDSCRQKRDEDNKYFCICTHN